MADPQPKNEDTMLVSEVRGIVDPRTLPTNPKRVIRTYATDVAKLKGTPAPEVPKAPIVPPKPAAPPTPVAKPAPRPPAPPPPPPKITAAPQPAAPAVSLSDAVSKIKLPAAEPQPPRLPPLTKREAPLPQRSPAARPQPSAPPKSADEPREWERIVERKKPSFVSKLFAFIFGTRQTVPVQKSPTPQMPVKPVARPAPAPVPPPPAPATPAPAAPTTFKPAEAAEEEAREREAVLARLRARVETYQSMNVAPPPVFPTPPPQPVSVPRPVYVPPPTPTATKPPETERLHTYTSDFSSHIDTEHASAFSVYAAQADTQKGPVTITVTRKQNFGLAYALGGAVLIIGGSLLLYFGYTSFIGTQPVAVTSNAPVTLISGDDQTAIGGTGSDLMVKLADAANASIPVGTIRIVYFTASATSTEPGGALIKALQLPAPDILLRNIGANSTVGIVHAGDETRAFFILAATSYERTFAGMLSWEATIGDDLSRLYPDYLTPAPAPLATTTATTTPSKNGKVAAPPAPVPPAKPRFVDEVVASHDVRALKDAEGRTLLLYGYRDQQTLIIARDETTFAVLLARLSATSTQ